ncbi:MAG TPA: hypothetical protein VN956_17345 [Pyrinomonadaceae bacterium]|nr:hypothetical protein [Pyrinomonadaceae bacterium]
MLQVEKDLLQTEPASPASSVGGIHISRGVRMRIPPGGLIISEEGPGMGVTRVELQLDTCVHWLEIALENLAAARSAHRALLLAKGAGNDLAGLLDREFKSSVQASVAVATFFEALYAVTLDRLPSKPTAHVPGKRQRRGRYVRVTEQLRKSFGLRKQGTSNLRLVLGEVYRFRDEAVHPSATFAEPVLHPQLQIGVERRFVMFGYNNTLPLVRAALAFSKILPSRDMSRRPKEMQEFAAYLLEVCAPLYAVWEETYGALLEEGPSVT